MAHFERLLDSVHLATRKLASATNLKSTLRDVLAISVEAVEAEGGTIYLHDPATQTLHFEHVLPEEVADKLEKKDIPDTYGVAGAVFHSRVSQLSLAEGQQSRRRAEIEDLTGVRVVTMLTAPLAITGMDPIGVVQLVNKRDGDFTELDASVLDTLSGILTLSLLNARLSEQRNRVASLEGMGRAAHDLANKAGVLVTFLPHFRHSLEGLRQALEGKDWATSLSHVEMLEGLYGDVFSPYSDRVFRYARLINDLAAGKRLTPKMRCDSFAAVVEQSIAYMEARARQHKVDIRYDLQEDAPLTMFDELYVMRIAENLVSNAIKATRDTIPPDWMASHEGVEDAAYKEVLVRYRFDAGSHVLEVVDQGVGMSEETVQRIFAGEMVSRWGTTTGTGLGTKVVLDLAAAHHAKVSIDTARGKGTTFRIAFPHSPCEQREEG